MTFARGFKAEAERMAEQTRAELDLDNRDPLDAHLLADHLSIPIWRLSTLHKRVDKTKHPDLPQAFSSLLADRRSPLSAMTVFRGHGRVIVHNDGAEPPRQLSNLTHELAHGLLMHESTPAIDERGCRNWRADIEDEAAFLGGALIITGKGARWIAKAGISMERAARRFGCSEEMVRWRLNMSGARKLMT